MRELSKKAFSTDSLSFPFILRDMTCIGFKFDEHPSNTNRQYVFELFEYLKDKPVRKHITRGNNWEKGQSFAFDLAKDYPVEYGKRYSLKATIYIENNREVFDIVFIDLR